jgi:hypothetical protein
MERIGGDLTELLSQHLPGGTEKETKALCQDSGCSGRDSNRVFPEHTSETLPFQTKSFSSLVSVDGKRTLQLLQRHWIIYISTWYKDTKFVDIVMFFVDVSM